MFLVHISLTLQTVKYSNPPCTFPGGQTMSFPSSRNFSFLGFTRPACVRSVYPEQMSAHDFPVKAALAA